jgi:shikimate dehydrogenase
MRCGVVGDPVDHSLSPALHRAAYAACGLDWEYDAHQVAAGTLARFVDGLGREWRGLSVTAPLKREAARRAEVVSTTVEIARVANTLVREQDGAWYAHNTDVPGAAAALRERWSAELSAATIVGGGATAASVGLALAELGVRRLRLLVRDPGRATDAVSAIGRHPGAPTVDVGRLGDGGVVGEVLVSTIPAAAQTDALVARCAAVPVLFDVVYHPWPTPLVEAALRSDEQVLVTGLDLLVHQAALQFELYTGRPAPLAAMRSALP